MPKFTVEIPGELVPRFKAILPPDHTPEQAIVKLVKLAILDTEAKAFATAAGQTLDQTVRARRAELVKELEL